MHIYISFRHMDPSDPLKEYAEEKTKRAVRKYIRDNFDAQVTLAVEKFRHIAHFLLNYKGFTIKCEESSDDMYSSIDLALDKLERQIRRYKDKLRKHKPGDGRDQVFNHSVIAAPTTPYGFDEEEMEAADDDIDFDEEDDFEDDFEEPASVGEQTEENLAPTGVQVLHREVMVARPMHIDDAIMQLDLEQREFLVFMNSETLTLNVIYRQKDGNFSLIETHQ